MDHRKILMRIKDRYCIVNGKLVHHGDCDIYQAAKIYGHSPCCCGLIHDLRILRTDIAEVLYPKFSEDLIKSDLVWEPCDESSCPYPYKEPSRPSKEEMEKSIQELEEHLLKQGVKSVECTEEDIRQAEIERQEDLELVQEIFGDSLKI